MLAEIEVPLLVGRPKPRIAPPVPVRSDVAAFRRTAEGMGIELMPWQETAARYLTAIGPEGRHLYREVCIVVARQNGKTHLMKPLIIQSLREGKRIMHIAQTRVLPQVMFGIIASSLEEGLFLRRRGKGGKMHTIWPRYGSGQEEILLANGGSYRIAAASRGSARGHTNDIVIIDELREMESDAIIGDTESTMIASDDPQFIYLSNAGTDDSIVLNEVRGRAGNDASLAYLEWSAAPERSTDDRDGWVEANPAYGHIESVGRSLEALHRRHTLAGTVATFETENLCRWVNTMREPLVVPSVWIDCKADEPLTDAARPFMGVSMDPAGKRASAVLAWMQSDQTIGLRVLREAVGNPIDTDLLGADLRDLAKSLKVQMVGFDPLTDAELARFFPKSEPVTGQKYANASSRFVATVEARKVRWQDAASVGDDLTWTARKEHDESGSFQAVRADDARPINAALAAIRAVWLASGQKGAGFKRKPQSMGVI